MPAQLPARGPAIRTRRNANVCSTAVVSASEINCVVNATRSQPSLPSDVIERAMVDKNREMLLVVAKALGFSWSTTMSLLFLGAKDHRITAKDLKDLENEFASLNVGTSRSVVEFYKSRKNSEPAGSGTGRQPQLHAH